jgi:hypothetical protein
MQVCELLLLYVGQFLHCVKLVKEYAAHAEIESSVIQIQLLLIAFICLIESISC